MRKRSAGSAVSARGKGGGGGSMHACAPPRANLNSRSEPTLPPKVPPLTTGCGTDCCSIRAEAKGVAAVASSRQHASGIAVADLVGTIMSSVLSIRRVRASECRLWPSSLADEGIFVRNGTRKNVTNNRTSNCTIYDGSPTRDRLVSHVTTTRVVSVIA